MIKKVNFTKIAITRPAALVVVLLLLWAPAAGFAGDLRVGAAAVSITPELGTPLAGYYYARVSKVQ